MSERLANWLLTQRRLVDDGVAAAFVKLEGPDEKVWGTWPVSLEKLEDVVEQAFIAIGEELPTGRHQARLYSVDGKGEQLSVLPKMLTGRSQQARSAASEHTTHAKALAMNVATAESQLATMANRAERAETRAVELSEGIFKLIETVTRMQTEASDDEIKRQESLARCRAIEQIGGQVAQNIGPLLALATEALADRYQKYQEACATRDAKKSEEDSREEPNHSSDSDRAGQTTGASPDDAERNQRDDRPTNGVGRKRSKERRRKEA